MNSDKVIEEVDEKLEGDMINTKNTAQISSIYG